MGIRDSGGTCGLNFIQNAQGFKNQGEIGLAKLAWFVEQRLGCEGWGAEKRSLQMAVTLASPHSHPVLSLMAR